MSRAPGDTSDPESRLARKSNGTTAKLSFSAHSLMENRNGLLIDIRIAAATGTAERKTALAMVDMSCLVSDRSVG